MVDDRSYVYFRNKVNVLTQLLLQLGALQAAILGPFLIFRKVNRKANTVLGVLVLILGLLCFLQSLKSIEIYSEYPHLIRLDWGGGLIIAPLIYYYVCFMTGRKSQFQSKDLGAFFPYIIHVVVVAPFLIKGGEAKVESLDYYTATLTAGVDNYQIYYKLLVAFTALIGLRYCWESLKVLKLHAIGIKSEFSALQKRQLQWLKYLVWAFGVLFTILLGVYVLYMRDRYASFDYEVYFYVASFLLIYAITYNAINQPQLEGVVSEISASSKKLRDQKAGKEDYAQLKERLISLMISEKVFLENDLTATQLAEKLDISRHQLSQVFSESLETSFYDFINAYRVQEFTARLESGEAKNLTLLAIAYESGFNSKTAFNAAFKRIKGITPSQFKKELDQKTNQ